MILVKILMLTVFLANCEAAKILTLYQAPFLSHHRVFRTITEELLKRGHEIVSITTDAAFPKGQLPRNMTEINIHDLTYSVWRKEILDDKTERKHDLYSQVQTAVNLCTALIRSQYKSEEIHNLIKNKDIKFDLIIADGVFHPALAFTHIYDVPLIQISTTSTISLFMENIGVPRHVIYYPNILRERTYNLTTWEIYKEVYLDLNIEAIFAAGEKDCDKEIRKGLISTAPPLNKLMKNVHLVISNTHSIWEGVRPRPMNFMNVNELQPKATGVIPEEIHTYLNSSTHGVIYMSFGTSVIPSTLPPGIIKVFSDVLSQLPYDVLWKWDKDEMPNKSENVRLFKWLPQADILAHPKVKLFITQGGQQSTDEAIHAGVPLICIPILFDQYSNAERYVLHGIGAKLDIKTVTSDEFKDTIETVIGNKSYIQNIIKLRTLTNDKPMASIERVMWAIEYVLRHGGAHHMRSPSANLSWTEFFEFELTSIFAAVSATVLYLVVKFLLFLKSLVTRTLTGFFF